MSVLEMRREEWNDALCGLVRGRERSARYLDAGQGEDAGKAAVTHTTYLMSVVNT